MVPKCGIVWKSSSLMAFKKGHFVSCDCCCCFCCCLRGLVKQQGANKNVKVLIELPSRPINCDKFAITHKVETTDKFSVLIGLYVLINFSFFFSFIKKCCYYDNCDLNEDDSLWYFKNFERNFMVEIFSCMKLHLTQSNRAENKKIVPHQKFGM